MAGLDDDIQCMNEADDRAADRKAVQDKTWETFRDKLWAQPPPEEYRVLFFYSREERSRDYPWNKQGRPIIEICRVTRCITISPGQDGIRVTEAVCSLKDNFSKRIGRQVAYRRMMEVTPEGDRDAVRRALPPGCRL